MLQGFFIAKTGAQRSVDRELGGRLRTMAAPLTATAAPPTARGPVSHRGRNPFVYAHLPARFMFFFFRFSVCNDMVACMIQGNTFCDISSSRSLSASFLPYGIRINITFFVLAGVGAITYILSRRLKAEEYETAHAREEVVHIDEDND